MNRQCYRLIFSRVKGRWVVTSEQASRRGKGSRGEGATLTGASDLSLPLGNNVSALRPLRMAVLLASMGLVGADIAQAQILPDRNAPSNQRPHVVNTANGTPQVNIQTPNRKGLSHNTYRQFDVDGKGAILNNSRNNTQTQIGGWVQANPNLAKGEARVILNEVNSRDPSRLRGPIEVAGSRADVIIANPAGLQINGGKFINASNVTLTTGNPLYRDGMINGYHVGGGKIEIAGGGLDTRDSDYTALLARAVEVQAQASLQANDLTVIAGANRISADLKDVTAIQGQGTAPQVAIDVAHLGGMYANEIRLVATEAGVGVHNAGQIGARAGELRVTANGRVENTGLLQSSTSNTWLSAKGGIRNSGDVTAARELTLTTPRDIDNSHGTLSAPRLDFQADSLSNLYGEIEQTGSQALALNAGSLSNRQGGRIGLPEPDSGGGNNSGTDSGTSGGGSSGNGGGANNGGGSAGDGSDYMPEVLADGRLNIASTLNNDAGTISAAHMDLVSSTGLNNAGGHIGLGELTLKGGNLNNQGGELIIDGPADIQVNQVNNNAGVWQISGPLTFTAQDVYNRGGTLALSDTSATTLNLYGAVDNGHGVFDNTQGTLTSNASQLTLKTGTLYNEGGTIEHAGSAGLMLSSADLYGRDGTITTAGAMQLTAAEVDHRGATLNAEQLTLDADSFDSRGGHIVLGGDQPSTLTVRHALNNGAGGTLASNGDLDIRAATLGNAGGQILHAGDGQLTVHTQRLNGNGGTITSNGYLGLYDGSFDLSDGTTQAQRITVDGQALITAGGSLTALGNGQLTLTTTGHIDNRAGRIATNGDLWLEALSVNNQAVNHQGGTFNVFGDAHFDVAETLDNSQGTITSGGDQSIQAATFRNVSGSVEHAGDGTLTIDTAQLSGNGGTIVSNGHLDLYGGILDLSNGTTQAQRITIDGQRLITAGGRLVALGGDTLTLTTRGQLDNHGGTLQSGGDVVIKSRGLNNASGAILGTALDINTRKQTLDNSAGGTIATIKGRANDQGTEDGYLIIHSGELNNDSGLIQSLADLSIDTAGKALINTHTQGDDDTPRGLISADSLTLTAGKLNNDEGVIGAAADVTLTATSLSNKGGTVQAEQQLAVSVDKTLDNSAGLLASATSDVDLTSGGKLTNDKGIIQAQGKVDSTSRGLGNVGGTILGTHIDINTRQQLLDNRQNGVIATLPSEAGKAPSGNGSLIIHSGELNNDSGLIQSQGDMVVDTAGHTLTNTDTQAQGEDDAQRGLISGGALTINPDSNLINNGEGVSGDVNNTGGWIAAQQALNLHAAKLINTEGGVIVGADSVTLNATSLANQDGTVQADGALTANVDQQIENQRGVLVSREGDTHLTSDGKLFNDGGAIQAQGRADIISAGLSNIGGSILGAEIDINTRKHTLDNSANGIIATLNDNTGKALSGDGSVTIHSGELNNDTGLIQSQGDMVVDTAGQTLTNTHSGEKSGLISRGALTINRENGETVYGDVLNDGGVISAQQALIAHASTLSNTGGGVILGADSITLDALSLDNQSGAIQSDGALTAAIGQQIDNENGVLVSRQGDVSLTGGDKLSNDSGVIQAQGRADIISTGLSNIGGSILGAEIDINTRKQTLDNSAGGTIATISDKEGEAPAGNGASQGPETGLVTIHSGALNNDSGLIQSQGNMVVETAGHTLTNTNSGKKGGLISGGGMNLTTGDLDNAAGLVSAKQALIAHVGKLSNKQGVIGSAAKVTLNARGVGNQGGQLLAGEGLSVILEGPAINRFSASLDTVTGGQLDNTEGLISAGSTLYVNANTLNNSETLSDDPNSVLGLQGDTVELHASQIDNAKGLIAADSKISITRGGGNGSLDNSEGMIASQGSLDITRDAITNTAGTLFSSGNQTLTADTLSGDGRVLSQGDLTVTLRDDFTNAKDAEITANGKVVFDTQGKLTNHGVMQADDLRVHGAEVDNRLGGVISAGNTEVIADGSLTNRGLIDGDTTYINATTLDNIGSGRIYGDHLAIQADTLTNRKETLDGETASATIAARERLDIGVGTLVNRGKDSLIFSAGSGADALNIAGHLDDQRHATGIADQVDNIGATIESLGGLTIHARELNNLNPHFTTEEVQVEGPTGYITIVGGKRYPAPGIEYDVSLFDWYDKAGGQYVKRNDPVSGFTDKPGGATYIAWNGTPPPKEDAVLGWSPTPRVADADYPINNPAWTYFGVMPPAPEPKEPRPDAFTTQEAYQAAHAQWQSEHASWEADSQQRYAALDEEIAAYNTTFGTAERIAEWHQHIQDWTQFEGERSVYETQTLDSTPGKILSGGDMTLQGGTLLNDKSQIIAGGALTADFLRIENRDAEGTRRVHYEDGGERWFTDGKRCSGNYCRSRDWELLGPWVPADETTTIDLSVARMESHQNGSGGDHGLEDRHTGSVDDEARGPQAGPQGGELKDITASDGGQSGQIVEVVAVATKTQTGGRNIEGADLALPDSNDVAPPDANGSDIAGPDSAAGQALAEANPDTPEVVRTVSPELSVPTSSLFQLAPATNADVLIETDPRFTDRREWLSSDYMLKAVQQDPTTSHKRMGDGLYEQRLIAEQIMRLTGLRYLDGQRSDEDQFRALMNAGLTFAAEHQLRPGIGLTAAQMAQLTSDIVWLVEREVTLADGSTEKVLVPQVYVRVREGDLNGDGTLLAGDSVNFTTRDDLVNSGTIAGRTAVELNTDNLRNLNGRITGDSVVAHARTDIDNIGGVIDAERLLEVSAGRDINIESTTSSGVNQVGASDFSHTMIDRLAGLYVSGKDGVLKAEAGRDVTLKGSEVISTGSVGIDAGRDLQLGTLDLSRYSHVERDSRNYITEQRDSEVGSRISAEGTLIMDAGRDVIARAAQADAGGALVARAGNDIRIGAGEASQSYKEEYNKKHSGFLSSKTTKRRTRREESEGIASQFGGDTVFLDAGRDLDVIGSEVISDHGTTLSAGGDIGITPSEHYANEDHYEKTSKSGVFSSGASITLGSQSQSLDQEQRGIYHSGSTVGAIDGDVNILAGGDYQQIGSDVLAPGGDINITASSIAIVESHDSLSTRSEERMKQGGLSLGVSGAVVTAINTVDNMREASRNTDSERMQGLAAAGSALHLYNNADDLAAAGQALASGDVSNAGSLYISIGGSSSKNVTETDTRTARGSQVLAGGDVTLIASGEGADSDLHIRGSEINAGGQANLAAEGDLLIESAENTSTLEQDSRNHSGSIGISIGQQTGITVAASVGRGEGEGDDLVHTNSLVKGGEGVRFISGGDTRLEGARIEAPQVQGDVGGDLTIASRQDTSDYESSSFQAGGSITIGPVSGGSLSFSGQQVDAEYASVTEQSGIFTGDGGFQIDVQGNTDLIGGAIASTDKAVEEGRNRLDTASITTKDIINQAEYDGQGIGISAGFGETNNNPEFTGSQIGVAEESGSDSGITRAGVSGIAGHKDIRTGDDAGGIEPIVDPHELEKELDAQVAITGQFGHEASEAWGEQANGQWLDALERGDSESAQCWSANGACRAVGHLLIGGATGGVEGAAGAVASTQVAPAVANALKDSGLPQDVQTAIAALAAAGAGGVIGGAQGAGAAYNEAENNYQGFIRFAAQVCSRRPACAALAVGEGAKTPIGALVAATLLIDAWNKENNRTETPANANQLPGIPGYPADTDTQTPNTEYPAGYDIDRPGRFENPAENPAGDTTSPGGYQPEGTDLIGGPVYSEGDVSNTAANEESAVVDTRKFSDYIFKPDADHGKNVVFESLGYTADDSANLSRIWQVQAAQKYASGEFTLGKADQYGQRINIEIALPGKGAASGQTSYLQSGWMVQPDGSLKLNTPFSGFTRSRQ
ncbi:hemagglutinin repeat-containing protein [Halomonas binhaiensis]|uniref:Hemagglutinin repeat-containing protein n=1 Tax=Halomonas binhaiensis TaxID=2562282 RepID=A0A5C1NH28_9GAMM|nr:hemagglutinin repeat-containing protein [Halomonas binhaiensis]QEM81963.1 hemagglutinin repeat-containing protein [Halomonas binhaiensis]